MCLFKKGKIGKYVFRSVAEKNISSPFPLFLGKNTREFFLIPATSVGCNLDTFFLRFLGCSQEIFVKDLKTNLVQ